MRCTTDSRERLRGKIHQNPAHFVRPPIFVGGEHRPSVTTPPPLSVWGGRRARRTSTQPRKQRSGRQRHQPKHQMTHHFLCAPHAHPTAPIPFLQQTVHPLAGRAFVEPLGFGRREGRL